nr:MAG TPA: hypothetical protein [Caudoviricetes sp.]
MHIQYQRYPAGVAHEIIKVRCSFVRNQGLSQVKPQRSGQPGKIVLTPYTNSKGCF